MGGERQIRSNRTNSGRANYPNPRSHVRAPRQQRRRPMRTRILLMIRLAFCATSAKATEEPADAGRTKQLAVKLAGFGSKTCSDWLSSASHKLEGAVWIYGFWSGLNYVAAASEQNSRGEQRRHTRRRRRSMQARAFPGFGLCRVGGVCRPRCSRPLISDIARPF
jgi:hypothetical protein